MTFHHKPGTGTDGRAGHPSSLPASCYRCCHFLISRILGGTIHASFPLSDVAWTLRFWHTSGMASFCDGVRQLQGPPEKSGQRAPERRHSCCAGPRPLELELLWAERRHPFCAGPLPPPEWLTLLSAEWRHLLLWVERRHPFDAGPQHTVSMTQSYAVDWHLCWAGPLPPPERLSLLWLEHHTVSRTPRYPTKADCHRDVLQCINVVFIIFFSTTMNF